MDSVNVGPTTVAGGAVTLAAYAVAVVAFINGARDEETMSALVVGTLSLLTTLGGRYAQAVAQVKAPQPVYVDRDTSAWSGHVQDRQIAIMTEAPNPAGEVPGGGVPIRDVS